MECVEVSALTGAGIDDLLGLLVLQSEVLELQANPKACLLYTSQADLLYNPVMKCSLLSRPMTCAHDWISRVAVSYTHLTGQNKKRRQRPASTPCQGFHAHKAAPFLPAEKCPNSTSYRAKKANAACSMSRPIAPKPHLRL